MRVRVFCSVIVFPVGIDEESDVFPRVARGNFVSHWMGLPWFGCC